jgi:hypothetical protein
LTDATTAGVQSEISAAIIITRKPIRPDLEALQKIVIAASATPADPPLTARKEKE